VVGGCVSGLVGSLVVVGLEGWKAGDQGYQMVYFQTKIPIVST
jgi:hypothetical protein